MLEVLIFIIGNNILIYYLSVNRLKFEKDNISDRKLNLCIISFGLFKIYLIHKIPNIYITI